MDGPTLQGWLLDRRVHVSETREEVTQVQVGPVVYEVDETFDSVIERHYNQSVKGGAEWLELTTTIPIAGSRGFGKRLTVRVSEIVAVRE